MTLKATHSSISVSSLPLMEQFYSIQGEGFYQGHAATFIRLAGCDVGCVWCDVKESWEEEKHPIVKVDDIIKKAASFPADICIITGGEPLIHQLDYLTEELHKHGKRTHMETSGTHPVSGQWDWVCFSPKKFKEPLPEIFPLANELKVVVYHPSDLEWAESFAEKVALECKLFLQPEWSKADKMIPLITDYIKQHPQWEISLQIHKYMNVR